MDKKALKRVLDGLPLGAIRYYETIGSTNLEALEWVKNGAPDLAAVIADEQTLGYGRRGRRWYTPKGEALALSLIIHPTLTESRLSAPTRAGVSLMPRLTALGALAVADTLRDEYKLDANIKWPNDVLVCGYKLAGILVEALWLGEILAAAVIGIGVNVRVGSIPAGVTLDSPTNCLENMLNEPVDRAALLGQILKNLLFWRTRIFTDSFLKRWEKSLAYLDEWVTFMRDQVPSGEDSFTAQILGLGPDGALRILMQDGSAKTLLESEFRIRPSDDKE